jgi:hypothetical protein
MEGGVKRPDGPQIPKNMHVHLRPHGWAYTDKKPVITWGDDYHPQTGKTSRSLLPKRIQMPIIISEEKRKAADHVLNVSHIIWTVVRPRLIEIDRPRPCQVLDQRVPLWGSIDTVAVGNALFPLTVLAAKHVLDIKPSCFAWALTGGFKAPVAWWFLKPSSRHFPHEACAEAYWLAVHYCLPAIMTEMHRYTIATRYTLAEIIEAMCGTVGPNWRETIDLLLKQLPTRFDKFLAESKVLVPHQIGRGEVARRAIGYYIKENTTEDYYDDVQRCLIDLLTDSICLDQTEHTRWLVNEFDVELSYFKTLKI